MNFTDILGFGKVFPIDKLFDIVSKSAGTISKPYFDRRDADTRAYEIEKLAEARAKALKIITTAIKENLHLTGGIEYKEDKFVISSPNSTEQPVLLNPQLEERTNERLNFQEAKKQLNIESVTAFATEELKDEPPVTDEPVDEDWSTRFFRIVEDVSNEEMQALWGKILAGEIKQPKTYSLRTLELIRNLSKNEADTFMKVANFAISSGGKNYIFKGKDAKALSEKFNVTYMDLALLIEVGLIQPGNFVNHLIKEHPTDFQRIFISGNIILIANIKGKTPTIDMPVHVFSNSGNELLKLIEPSPPFEYLEYFANSYKNNSFDLKYGTIKAREDGNISYTYPLKDFK